MYQTDAVRKLMPAWRESRAQRARLAASRAVVYDAPMNRTRELLHEAAREFADRIYELVRAELVEDVRRSLGLAVQPAAPSPAPASTLGTTLPKQTLGFDRVVTFVREHPGCAPKDLVAALGVDRNTAFAALGLACSSNLLRKEGAGRAVRYFPAGDGHEHAPPAESIPMPRRGPRATTAATTYQLIQFVNDHPGCRYGEIAQALAASESAVRRALQLAKEQGAIRMEGTRITARYFPSAAVSSAPIEPPTPEPPPPTHAETTPLARERAQDLLDELDDALNTPMHPIRLETQLQAIVAEIRELRPAIAEDEPVASLLDRAMRRIGAVRREAELGFITGLKRDAEANWHAIARRARERLAAFDRDSEQTPTRPSPTKAPNGARERPPNSRPSALGAPPEDSFTALRARTAELPLLLIGGIKKNEVLEQVRRRYGLDAEWIAAQGSQARAIDSFLERVRHGRVGAVVVLEGLFGTTNVKSVVAALKAAEIPFAYGDRAGTDSLRGAFAALDRGLSAAGVPAPDAGSA